MALQAPVQMVPTADLTLHNDTEMFPQMSHEDFIVLREDIRQQGIKVPLIVDEQMRVRDGRHRFRAARELKLPEVPVVVRNDSDEEIRKEIIATNLLRRHLSESQRAWAAIRFVDSNGSPYLSDDKAAKIFNVGRRSVERARYVSRKGCPELFAAINGGLVKIGPAAMVSTLPHADQIQLVRAGAKAIKARAKQLNAELKDTSNTERQIPRECIRDREDEIDRIARKVHNFSKEAKVSLLNQLVRLDELSVFEWVEQAAILERKDIVTKAKAIEREAAKLVAPAGLDKPRTPLPPTNPPAVQ